MGEVRDGAATSDADQPLKLTEEEDRLHGELLRWYLWSTQRIGQPAARPRASLEAALALNARIAANRVGELQPNGMRRFPLVIEPSMLALVWAGDEQLGFEDHAQVGGILLDGEDTDDVTIGVAHASQERDLFVVLQIGRRRQLVLGLEGARELARSILGAVATIDGEERDRVKAAETSEKPNETP